MNQRIRDLRDVSSLDAALRALAERREAKTRAVKTAEEALAGAEAGLTSKREEIRTFQKEADAMNLEILSAEEHVEKLETQRNSAKSNKEYEVFTREIEAEKKKLGALEDEVLVRLERIDELTEQERSSRQKIEEDSAALASAQGELAKAEGEFASEEAGLSRERKELAAKIDPEDLTLYDRILEMRKDSAVSVMEEGSCRACARRLTPQLENLVMLGEEIVQCMSCSRILYVDEEGDGA